eukprot:CAMPEP_0194504678 /NCGR_PEP_ID=MMETSP0253-20130528/29084_1 /TAXON_ID=2966 /ORGANISM="Noctiluca scintillans" /LENGTH=349 /DNA_ID=CAMNT_0039347101 /DNA_START=91 /DNA_END=1140 /DNA_ORIENTATION=+
MIRFAQLLCLPVLGVALRTFFSGPGGTDGSQVISWKPNCTKGGLETEVLSKTDVFLRSYIGDLEWLPYSTRSITESMTCRPGVIRYVHLVVPKKNVSAFKATLDAVFREFNLTASLRSRWRVTPSHIVVIPDGYQEQMLDKVHADEYSDAEYIAFMDTDSVYPRDFTSDLAFGEHGKPYLCYRTVESCGNACAAWMQGHVRNMIGDTEALENEYMCALGSLYPRKIFSHFRKVTSESFGEPWDAWVQAAHGEGATIPWQKGFTEFNAFGALLWRDFHTEMHWIDMNAKGERAALNTMVHPNAIWSWEKDPQRIRIAKRSLECLIQHQHDGGDYSDNGRRKWCLTKAEGK